MEWLFFALLSALFASLVTIFGKIGIKDVDPTFASAIRAGVMFAFLLGIIGITGKWKETMNRNALFYILLAALSGALSWLFYFVALKFGEASKVASVDRLSLAFVFFFSILFLGESLSLKDMLGALLMIVGAVLIALKLG
ncbi:EamA family transporter [Nanoarchaeota archaeon]|nr:MAG: EamA family transporter [Nanoarchaeota archaeon]